MGSAHGFTDICGLQASEMPTSSFILGCLHALALLGLLSEEEAYVSSLWSYIMPFGDVQSPRVLSMHHHFQQ